MKNFLTGAVGTALLQINISPGSVEAIGKVLVVLFTIYFQYKNSQNIKRKILEDGNDTTTNKFDS